METMETGKKQKRRKMRTTECNNCNFNSTLEDLLVLPILLIISYSEHIYVYIYIYIQDKGKTKVGNQPKIVLEIRFWPERGREKELRGETGAFDIEIFR